MIFPLRIAWSAFAVDMNFECTLVWGWSCAQYLTPNWIIFCIDLFWYRMYCRLCWTLKWSVKEMWPIPSFTPACPALHKFWCKVHGRGERPLCWWSCIRPWLRANWRSWRITSIDCSMSNFSFSQGGWKTSHNPVCPTGSWSWSWCIIEPGVEQIPPPHLQITSDETLILTWLLFSQILLCRIEPRTSESAVSIITNVPEIPLSSSAQIVQKIFRSLMQTRKWKSNYLSWHVHDNCYIYAISSFCNVLVAIAAAKVNSLHVHSTSSP